MYVQNKFHFAIKRLPRRLSRPTKPTVITTHVNVHRYQKIHKKRSIASAFISGTGPKRVLSQNLRKLIMWTRWARRRRTKRIRTGDIRTQTFLDVSFEFPFSGLEFAHCFSIAVRASTEDEPDSMYQSLQSCLDLRDKYMSLSRQRLGDNPRDYDGVFHGVDEDQHGVAAVPPDSSQDNLQQSATKFKPWVIYPAPPPRHWKKDKEGKTVEINSTVKFTVGDDFDFKKCEIPGEDSRVFELDKSGVYQVFADLSGMFGILRLTSTVLLRSCYHQMRRESPFSMRQLSENIMKISITLSTSSLMGQRKASHSNVSSIFLVLGTCILY